MTDSENARWQEVTDLLQQYFGPRPIHGSDSEDMVQETSTRLLEWHRQTGEMPGRPLIRKFAQTVWLETLRRRDRSDARRDKDVVLEDLMAGDAALLPEDSSARREVLRRWLLRFERLQPNDIEFFVLIFADDLHTEEAGRRCDLSAPAAWSTRQRVFRELRKKRTDWRSDPLLE
ncbi:MAG: hypothetical protein IPK26_21765 [Planctomycetes bacterium]|nr:hypothetical protein [Planctomycetota bacterium]